MAYPTTNLSGARIDIDPHANEWQTIELSEAVVTAYSLDEWARQFSLGTAGYRDQLDPADYASPGVPFNVVTLSILGEAKARVFARKGTPKGQTEIHIGGETRPHTQRFIAILARLYAAHEIRVHLR